MKTAALAVLLACVSACWTDAQLAKSFYNVTAIETRALPNAVRITIRTDGAVLFGADTAEFIDNANGRWFPRPITSFRLRLLRARTRVSSFVDIGAYPVDSAVVSLGTEPLREPFLNFWASAPSDPRLDITLRFYVPITIRRFVVARSAHDSYGHSDDEENAIEFGQFLGPRDATVEIGPDQRSVIITVISDRIDLAGGQRLRRSPPEGFKHHLSIQKDTAGLRIDALHTPLPELVEGLSRASGVPMTIRSDAASVDASLFLPSTTLDVALRALTTAYGLNVTPRPPEEGGGYTIGHNGLTSVTERIPLRNLKAVNARLLFPDFLLPMLHADVEQNALLVTGPSALVARVRQDVGKLDLPRPQVRVEAQIWEIAATDESSYALRAVWTRGRQSFGIDGESGEASYKLAGDQTQQVAAALTALQARGRARLAAEPFVVVGSGLWGQVFLGQQRYVTVLQGTWRQQVSALRLQIGYTLGVVPTVGAGDDITLELYPRVSTVDSVERGTGLPTLGIREMQSVVRVRPGESVVVAGLDSRLDFETRRRLVPAPGVGDLFGSRSRDDLRTSLLLLITARKES